MAGLANGVVLSSGLLIIAIICGVIARMTRLRQLEPNGVIGIRTKATRSSEAAWNAGHDAARPLVLVTCITAVTTAVALILIEVIRESGNGGEVLSLVALFGGYAVTLTVLILAGVLADRAAKKVQSRE